MLLLNFYQRGYTQYPPPVLPKEHTDLPFDVKALTRIPKEFADHERSSSLIPLCVNKGKHACVLRPKSDSLQTATAVCLVESRVLYVGAKESLRNISRSGEKGGPFVSTNGGK